jgi:hypothetical protein
MHTPTLIRLTLCLSHPTQSSNTLYAFHPLSGFCQMTHLWSVPLCKCCVGGPQVQWCKGLLLLEPPTRVLGVPCSQAGRACNQHLRCLDIPLSPILAATFHKLHAALPATIAIRSTAAQPCRAAILEHMGEPANPHMAKLARSVTPKATIAVHKAILIAQAISSYILLLWTWCLAAWCNYSFLYRFLWHVWHVLHMQSSSRTFWLMALSVTV